ncbi:MFS transporter [Cellulomonas alba]|uniref:MFS transporter n=1 Tax=Cellulomonas alba TaxID=3053467 RepID=A0ABT7SF11_9CELL|nr:MFS transporter [Cellulomonas alba]MDM7854629.1 MFS transporter [Cellulomonas alba]
MTMTSEQRASAATESSTTGTTAPEAPPTTPARDPLGRPFAAALGATGLANLGDGIVGVGAPLVALTLTRSATQIALLSAATWLPWLLLGLIAGVAVDRTDRRRTQMIAMLARAAVLGVGMWLVVSGHLSMAWLVAVVLAYGITEVFADIAQTSLVPDIVPRSRLQAANGRVLAVQQVANTFVGGPIAGAVLALGAAWVLGLPAGLALGAAVLLWRGVRGNFRPTQAAPSAGDDVPAVSERAVRRAAHEVRDGLAFLVRHPVLRPLVIAGSLMNMAFTAYFAVFVLWAVGPESRMGLPPSQYPLMLAALAVGAVLGSLVVERIVTALPELRVLVTACVSTAAVLVVPILVPNAWAVAGTLFLAGFCTTIGNVVSASMRQRMVPQGLLGRVSGASRTLGYGLMPVGAVLGGVVADAWGLQAVFWSAVVLSVAAACYPASVLRQRTIDAAELRD